MNCCRISFEVGICSFILEIRSPFSIATLRLGVNLTQGHAVLPSEASAILILGREDGRPAFLPAELALYWPPRRLDGTSAALKLVSRDRITANAKGRRLAK